MDSVRKTDLQTALSTYSSKMHDGAGKKYLILTHVDGDDTSYSVTEKLSTLQWIAQKVASVFSSTPAPYSRQQVDSKTLKKELYLLHNLEGMGLEASTAKGLDTLMKKLQVEGPSGSQIQEGTQASNNFKTRLKTKFGEETVIAHLNDTLKNDFGLVKPTIKQLLHNQAQLLISGKDQDAFDVQSQIMKHFSDLKNATRRSNEETVSTLEFEDDFGDDEIPSTPIEARSRASSNGSASSASSILSLESQQSLGDQINTVPKGSPDRKTLDHYFKLYQLSVNVKDSETAQLWANAIITKVEAINTGR